MKKRLFLRPFYFLIVFSALLFSFLTISVFLYYKKIPILSNGYSILILGTGGEGHSAPDLTDSMMFVYLNPSNNKITLLSLPRDLWITDIRAKINSAYHYGGYKMVSDSVQTVTGVRVDGVIVVDFSLFKDFIDSLGGIDIDVENSFTDTRYPIAGKENDLCLGYPRENSLLNDYPCRYETVIFEKGITKMNGETALKYVRSRNSEGHEGTDIARGVRQQKVIDAIVKRMLSLEYLLDISSLKRTYNTLVNNLDTNLNVNDFTVITRFGFENKNNVSFLTFPEELVSVIQNNKNYDYQYVFVPKGGTWRDFQTWLLERI